MQRSSSVALPPLTAPPHNSSSWAKATTLNSDAGIGLVLSGRATHTLYATRSGRDATTMSVSDEMMTTSVVVCFC